MEAAQKSPIAPALGEKNSRWPRVLAFAVPTLLVLVAYALAGIYPFGEKQALTIDLQHQYYPFLVEFRRRLLSGGSLQWTWQVGLGSSFVPLFSYYLASPLNLLFLLVPETYLREAVAVLTAIRAGLAGICCVVCLEKLYGARGMMTAVFSVCYALCGFFLGYFIDIIWLDTFAIAPLCVLCTVRLLREGKRAGYILSIALALWCNYYIGYMVCLFVLLVFLLVNALDWSGWQGFARRLGRIAYSTLIAVGLCAVILWPSVLAMQYYGGSLDAAPERLSLLFPAVSVLGNLGLTAAPTFLRGLPNLFTGTLCLMMLGLLLRTKKIRTLEKVLTVSLFVLLLASVEINVLDYVWHAFHNPKSLPARYTFLMSFVLVALSARVFSVREKVDGWDLCLMAVPVLVVAVCAFLGTQGVWVAVATCVALVLYLGAMALWASGRVSKRAVAGILCVLVCIESGVSVISAMQHVYPEDTSKRADYPYYGEMVRPLLSWLEQEETAPFYRVEMTRNPYTSNGPALLGYTGVTSFSSTINPRVATFLQEIGLSAKPEHLRHVYDDTSPLTNAFLDVDYYIAADGIMREPSRFWEYLGREKLSALYKNRYPLSLGFMVAPELLDFVGDVENPFLSQNRLFSLSTGLAGDLFVPSGTSAASGEGYRVEKLPDGAYAFTPDGNQDGGGVQFELQFAEDAYYYAYLYVEHFEFGHVYEGRSKREWQVMRPFIQTMGKRAAGETMTLEAFSEDPMPAGAARLYLYTIDADLFEAGYERLAAQQMQVTHREDTLIEGTVTAAQAGLLYTSIPYEPGWTAFVDGEQAEIALVGDAMLCVPLGEGTHTLRFAYATPGLVPGAVVTGVCLLLFAWVAWLDVRRKRGTRVETTE